MKHDNFRDLLCIIISSLFLAIAFIIPTYGALLLFLFLIPLYSIKQKTITFSYGFLWGIIFYSLYFHGIFFFILEYAVGWYKIPLFCGFLIYAACTSGVWFMVTAWFIRFFMQLTKFFGFLGNESIVFTLSWTLSSIIYFLYIHYLFFFPLGVVLGNKLNNPLIILSSWPFLIFPRGSYAIQLMFFYVFQASLYLTAYYSNFILLIFWLVFYGYAWISLPTALPSFVYDLTFVACVPEKRIRTYWQQATDFATIIKSLRKIKHLIIISPESAFPIALNEYQEFLSLWFENSDKYTIIMGAYRIDHERYYNSLYLLQQCRITQSYDKTLLAPLTEYIPPVYSSSTLIRNLFANTPFFTPGSNKADYLSINDYLFVPCICSEFFFDAFDQTTNLPLLVIVNDTWLAEFGACYIQRLFRLYAQYQAITLKRPIIYVSYTSHYIIAPNGAKHAIYCYKY